MTAPAIFASPVPALDGHSATFDGFTFTVGIERDNEAATPWDSEDGHGPVTNWTTRDKRPGELVLCEDRGSRRYYDFAEACAVARRDGWGAPLYRLDIETGRGGLVRANAQWFIGNELHTFASPWCDDLGDATRQAHAAHRASMPARQFAALAARADFERLRAWCRDDWEYVGVIVTVQRAGVELVPKYHHALWGIEGDSGDYLREVANELAASALDDAREKLVELIASE